MQDRLLALYRNACEQELQSFKPGNVSIHSEGHDMTVEDFRLSARVSAPFLCESGQGVGARIFNAVKATRSAVGCNTNLGILLLSAPLIMALQVCLPHETLKDAVRRVLESSTVEDAEWVYRAIRMASPGGLGEAPEEDVNKTPTLPLIEVMRLAEHRDRLAWQYTHSFNDIFDFTIPRYHYALSRWGNREWATVWVFVGLLARYPDSHVERRHGSRFSDMIVKRMTEIEMRLSDLADPSRALDLLESVDRQFKVLGINPGTTADLTVACILAVGLDDMRASVFDI